MKSSLQSMKEMVDVSLGSLLITNGKGRVVYANEQVSQKTGYSLPEIIGQEPGRLWGGRMPRQYYLSLWETIGKQKMPFFGQVTNVKKNGQSYHDHLSILPILDRGGKAVYYIALRPSGNVGTMIEELHALGTGIHTVRPGNLTARFFDWLDISEEFWPKSRNLSLASLIRDSLVAPLEEKYASRSHDHIYVRAARRDPDAFRPLYDKYHSLVLGYFLRHLSGDRSLAEDLTQDTFLRAYRRIEHFREENAAYGTYLLRIAHNLLVNHYRREKTPHISAEEIEAQASQSNDNPEWDDQSLLWLWNSKGLSSLEKKILTQFYHRGFTVREIATALKKSENAVKLHLSRGRQKLRSLLGP